MDPDINIGRDFEAYRQREHERSIRALAASAGKTADDGANSAMAIAQSTGSDLDLAIEVVEQVRKDQLEQEGSNGSSTNP